MMVWFKKAGWIYLPTSIIGVLITLITLFMLVQEFWAIDRNSHSVSDTLYHFFLFAVCHMGVYMWVAQNTCGKEQ